MKVQSMTILLFAVSAAFFSNILAEEAAGSGGVLDESVSENSSPAEDSPSVWTYTQITEANIEKAVDALPEIIEDAMSETGVPGIAVAVVRSDKILLTRGFGVRSVEEPAQVDADTVFQIASLSKPVGATVISRAVSNQVVGWNDPVSKYLPWFRIGEDDIYHHVTIGDLYAHRSGLPDHSGDHLEDLGFEREQILEKLRFLPTGPFRDQYKYTNFGLTAAAEAVAKAYETSWEQLSEELLYQPAGMSSTSSRYADYLAAVNRAVTHQRHSGVWVPGPPRNPDPQSPAGGVSSTANDMAKWMQLHLGNGILDGEPMIKANVIQVMRQPHNFSSVSTEPRARSSMYGFGLGTSVDGTGHVQWSHSGAFLLGAATNVAFIPGGDIGITVLTNGEPHGIPEAIVAQFLDILETGSVQRDWLPAYEQRFAAMYVNPSELAGKNPPLHPIPPESLNRYTGTYRNEYYGQATVTELDGELILSLGPVPYNFQLAHWDGNVFSYYPTGENAVGIAAVTFDPKNQAMTVENLDNNGLGTFYKNSSTEFDLDIYKNLKLILNRESP